MLDPIHVLAHGVGSRGTLPLPLWQFSWAAAAALVLSFVALGALWKRPKLGTDAPIRVVSRSRIPVAIGTWLLRAIGMALLGLTLGAALFGEDVPGEKVNLAPVTIYVMLWVFIPIVSALVGDIWKALNPFRTLALILPRIGDAPAPPHRWIAAATLFGFLFVELVHPAGDSPRILGWAMLVYTGLMVAGLLRHGEDWLDRADGLDVVFGLTAAMAPVAVRDGSLILRRPLSGLSAVNVLPGTTMAILIVLGGTSFDGFSESPIFTDIIGRPSGWGAVPPKTVGIVVMIAIAALLYWIGARTIARVTGISHQEAADAFGPSLMPIVWAYVIAHYAQLLVDQSQSFWFRLSNPYGRTNADGSPATDWFGVATGEVDLTLIDVDLVAWVQAVSIVVGHVLAVLHAHDLAVSRFDPRDAARSQQTMLVVMVCYSIAGLWLLFSA